MGIGQNEARQDKEEGDRRVAAIGKVREEAGDLHHVAGTTDDDVEDDDGGGSEETKRCQS
jgi:hypothetical protein